MQTIEVEANHATELTSVQENQELRLHTGIEVVLDHGCKVAVYSDVSEVFELVGCGLVILLQTRDHGVPLCCEVEQSECWTLLVKIGNHLIKVLWYLYRYRS